jgi:GNAT superfamily N-acetyltransferase
MIVIVKSILDDTERAFSGDEEQVESQIRETYPGLALSVEHGDLDYLIWKLGMCYGTIVEVPEGHVAKPELHLPIRFDNVPHECTNLCSGFFKAEPEQPIGEQIDGWLLEKAIADIKPGEDTGRQTNYRKDNIPSQVYDYSHVVPEKHKGKYRIEVHERPKGADYVKGGTWLEAFLVKHPFNFVTDDVGKVSGMVHPKYKNGDKDFRVTLSDVDQEHRGKGLGVALYEAITAHAKHFHSATHMAGGVHSSMAHNAHIALSKRHGLEYRANYLGEDEGAWDVHDDRTKPESPNYLHPDQFHPEPQEYDSSYSPYLYAIKHENEYELLKADRNAFKEAGFRNLRTGETAGTGVFHNIYELPEHWKVDEDNIDHIEAGFLDHQGKFYTRSEAAAHVASPKTNLQSEDLEGMGRKPGEERLGGGAGLVKMAIEDIAVGPERRGQKKVGLPRYSKFHDYQHVMTPIQKRHYFLTVREKEAHGGVGERGLYHVKLHSRRIHYGGWPLEIGYANVHVKDSEQDPTKRYVTVDDIRLHPHYRNKGLGVKMYEAAFAHAKHFHKATHVMGGPHSSSAGAIHRKLSEKHGMEYHASYNEDAWGGERPSGGDYDSAYGAYEYALKSEEPLQKMALADIKRGEPITTANPEGTTAYDYSHILPMKHSGSYEIHVHELPYSEGTGDWPEDPYTRDVEARLYHVYGPQRTNVGRVSGTVHPDMGLRVWHSEVDSFHRGKGLGPHLYEAMMAHAFHNHGIRTVTGSAHSSMAASAHRKLSAKHGFEGYAPNFNLKDTMHDNVNQRAPYDDAYGKYRYTLKAEGNDSWLALADNLSTSLNDQDSEVVEDMSGFAPRVHGAFEAARFLVNGRESLSLDQIRRALWLEDGDFERAALRAYGIEPDETNLSALRAVAKMGFMKKTENETPMRVECPIGLSANACSEVQRGISSGLVQHVNLNGKYSKGSMVVRDPRSEHVYLLKPDSEGISPAAGVNEEPNVSQPRREACYWQIANLLGLGSVIPRADLIELDGEEWAAIRLLPYNFKNLEKRWKSNKSEVVSILERLRSYGTLHKWAILDYILGNPDRHGQNLMVGHAEKMAPIDRDVVLIDHGSAFAGYAFAPSADANSFIPFYLRIWCPSAGFNKLSVEDKLRYMPTVSHDVNKMLKQWIFDMSEGRIKKLLEQYGIDPGPVTMRLGKLRALPDSPDIAINKLWAGAA